MAGAQILLQIFAELDIVLANVGSVSSNSLVTEMVWLVIEHCNDSGHQAIFLDNINGDS